MTRRVLVTGASSGIGRAVVRLLADRGDHVWAVARRTEELKKLQQETAPHEFSFSACDVTQPAQVQAAFRQMESAGFSPDAVVLNAGINRQDLIPHYNASDYRDVFETNLFGALVWVDAFLPVFLKRREGQFVAVSSMSAFLTHGRGAAYSASKSALSLTFQAFQKRYQAEGILFSIIHFGPIETAMWNKGRFIFLRSDTQAARQILKAIDRKKTLIDYPWSLVWMVRFHQLLSWIRF